MNIAKFLKGTTTIQELRNLPQRYFHVIYKQYILMLLDEEKKKQNEAEQMQDQMEEVMGG